MKLFFSLLVFSQFSFASISHIYDTKKQSCLTKDQIQLIEASFYVLGEFHNNDAIHRAQAEIISTFSDEHIAVMWEFLNHHDQESLNESLERLYGEEIDAEEFIEETAGAQNKQYAPIIEEVQQALLPFYGINIARKYKKKVMEDGLSSVSSEILPATLFQGTKNYKKRFIEAMGGHAPSDVIDKYFLAQYLTDSIMAEKSVQNMEQKNFIIAGSFHTDFYDGTVYGLNQLTNETVATFKIVNEAELTEEQKEELKVGHSVYGAFADYIVFAK